MTTAQDQQSRAEFEAKFGPMPWGCMWTGRGYCCTEFNAWDAQKYADKFEGWQAARALPAGEPVASIYISPSGEREVDDWRVSLPEGRNVLYTAPQVLAMGRVPAGWVAVPAEPDCGMVNAGEDAFMGRYDLSLLPDAYAAMLAAAPRPPAAQPKCQADRDMSQAATHIASKASK